MSDKLYRRLMIAFLTVAATSAVLLGLLKLNTPSDPCAHLWDLPASDGSGHINYDSLDKVFACYEAEGVPLDTLCPPAGSDWRQFVASGEC